MNTKEIIGSGGVSIINNPFLPHCIDVIHITALRLSKGMVFYGDVGFVNGKTQGTQKFEGESLADVYNQIATFCINLK